MCYLMKQLKDIWKPLTLVVLAMVGAYVYYHMDTQSNAQGLFSPTSQNQDAMTFYDCRHPQSQDVETTTEATALIYDVCCLRKDDVSPTGSTIIYDTNNDSVKYFRTKDDHVEKSDQDAGASNQTSMNRTSDQIAGKYPKISRAKHCQCDARIFVNTPAQLTGPDLPEKLTQADDLPQTFAIPNTFTISSTCGLEEWCEHQNPLKFKFISGVTILVIPELSQKDLDFKQNALKSTLMPKSAADLRTLDYLPENNAEPNRVFKITNAASVKTKDIQALKKKSFEQKKIANINFNADNIHFDNPKASSQMLQLCKKNYIAELLYSEQPNDFSHIVFQIKSYPNATWTALIPEKFQGASHKENRKLKGNICYSKQKINASMKECELIKSESLPLNFDARENWSECANVCDNSKNYSCWAHGSTDALNEKSRIKSEVAFKTLLSVAETAACCKGSDWFTLGCDVGQVASPCDQFKKTGVVSGVHFGQDEFCHDFTMPMSAHHVESTTLLPCGQFPIVAPVCGNSCPSKTSTGHSSDKAKIMSSYGVGPTFYAIKKEIFTYGSVSADFTICKDFLAHGSGVCQHLTGAAEGDHAIKCIGWGFENGQDYWLFVNSRLNVSGDQSPLKILMGDCGITDQMHAGNNRITPHSTATQNNDLKVRSDYNNLKTQDQTDGDSKITPTSATPALELTQASEDTVRPELNTAACDPADKICFNSQLVTAYQTDLDKCSNLDTECFKINFATARLACQGDLECEKALAAAASKIPKINLLQKKDLDRVTEPVAKRTNYHHCKCYKAAVEDALTKSNESRPFKHEVGTLNLSLDNQLLSDKCGIHDWDQLCGTIVKKNSLEDGSIQFDFTGLQQQEHASTHFRGRRLAVVPSGKCTGPTTNYNLLNTGVTASQNHGSLANNAHPPIANANVGCDGVIQWKNPGGLSGYRIVSGEVGQPVFYWVANFQQTTNVQSILYIEHYFTSRVRFLVGDDDSNNYQNNPPCTVWQLTAGGWLDCGRSGKYLVLTGTDYFQFMEVMCYSQYFVHHNALSSTLSSPRTTTGTYWCTTSTNCQASNVIRTTLVIWKDYPDPPNTPCCIYSSDPSTDPTLKVTLPAYLMIELVTITPSDQAPAVTDWQKNIEVSIVNSAGKEQLCGTLSDYNSYREVPCQKVGNQIIVKRPGQGINHVLAMAGLSILSNCDCSQSSLNPALIFDAKPLASSTTISTTSTGAPVSITLNKQMADTVSRVCGNADGFTMCGLRSALVFTDKMTGLLITFPYKGFELNSDQSNLILNPAKAHPTSVLTVTAKLENFPTVTFSQDITAIVEGAVAFEQFFILNMALNATINQEAFLDLPQLDAQYTYAVVSKQKFEALVDGNQLKVLSKNETDVGTYYLDLTAKSSFKKASFKVKVIFTLPTTIDTKTDANAISKEVNMPTTTTETKRDQMESIMISDEETKTLLETAVCIAEEANQISCLLPDGFSFQVDGESGKTFSGDSKKKAPGAPTKLPKLTISKVNHKGQFYIKFSEPVGFEALNITASQLRLDVGGAGTSSSSESNTTQLYLLSAKHLNLTIESENTTAAVFTWYATNITSTQIMIQLELQSPLFISTSAGVLDKLIVQIMPPALMFMRSMATGAMTEDPLRTRSRKLPPQVMPGTTIDIVEEAAKIFKNVGQSSSVTNIVVQTLLSGSMTQLWSMVNAQQIIMSQQQLNLQNPGNVNVVMTKLSDISSFKEVLPTDEILEALFDFTPTDSPGVGFECMGVEEASVTLYLGITFFIAIFIGLLYLAYSLAYMCRLYYRLMSKIEEKLKLSLCFGLFYLYLQESYLELAIGSALRIEQPKFNTPSDYFDFGLACAGILITLVFPCYCFFFLRKNVDKLDQKDFQSKHGALYEGFTTYNADRRLASIKMAAWFLLRRLLAAANVVYLRHQTIWIQLTFNMWLSFIDVCFKFILSPYKSKLVGFIMQFNDLLVLTCAYFPYLFTDLIPSPEDKYFIGWFYDGTVGTMISANLFVIMKTTFHSIIKKIREMIMDYRYKKKKEAYEAMREKQEQIQKLLQEATIADVVLLNAKVRAGEIQNGFFVDLKQRDEQFRIMRNIARKNAKIAALAHRMAIDNELAEIPEVQENSQISNRCSSVRSSDLEAQISDQSSLSQSQSSSSSSQHTPSSQVSCSSYEIFQLDSHLQAKENAQNRQELGYNTEKMDSNQPEQQLQLFQEKEIEKPDLELQLVDQIVEVVQQKNERKPALENIAAKLKISFSQVQAPIFQRNIERLQTPLRPNERQPVVETNVGFQALKDKRNKFLVFQSKWLENQKVLQLKRKELKIVQLERQAKFFEENDQWQNQVEQKLEQEVQLTLKQLARDIDELVQLSEEVRATLKKAELDQQKRKEDAIIQFSENQMREDQREQDPRKQEQEKLSQRNQTQFQEEQKIEDAEWEKELELFRENVRIFKQLQDFEKVQEQQIKRLVLEKQDPLKQKPSANPLKQKPSAKPRRDTSSGFSFRAKK